MSRAVTARRSAIRKATSESWRISLSVSCDTRASLPCRPVDCCGGLGETSLVLGPTSVARGAQTAFRQALLSGYGCALEMLVRWAVVAFGKRRALAGLPLACRC